MSSDVGRSFIVQLVDDRTDRAAAGLPFWQIKVVQDDPFLFIIIVGVHAIGAEMFPAVWQDLGDVQAWVAGEIALRGRKWVIPGGRLAAQRQAEKHKN